MSEYYYGFEKFCMLLDDSNILKKHSVMGVVKMLQLCIVEIKSTVLKDLLELDNSKIDFYLDSKILEIERQDYLKDYSLNKISHILENLNVTIDELKDLEYPTELSTIIDKDLSPDEYHENFDSIRATQTGLLLFFLSYYANELISFLESKKTSYKEIKASEYKIIDTQIVDGLLDEVFKNINESNNARVELIQKLQQLQIEGRDYSPELEEDFENDFRWTQWMVTVAILKLQIASVQNNYFFYDCAFSVYENHYEQRLLEFIREHIDASESDFIKQEIEDVYNPKKMRVLLHNKETVLYHKFIESEQKLNFSKNKKIAFLTEKLKNEGWVIKSSDDVYIEHYDRTIPGEIFFEKMTEIEKNENDLKETPGYTTRTEKQLTSNQIVLLLQETGFFAHPKIESAPKTKQSELISKICGLNAKNLKTKIENLDKKRSELGKNHQKDIDKIDDILNNLE